LPLARTETGDLEQDAFSVSKAGAIGTFAIRGRAGAVAARKNIFSIKAIRFH
jgi:hypothetical protein